MDTTGLGHLSRIRSEDCGSCDNSGPAPDAKYRVDSIIAVEGDGPVENLADGEEVRRILRLPVGLK